MAIVPTVHWQDNVGTFTEGLLTFGTRDATGGTDAVPGNARPLAVNDDGEPKIAELPGPTLIDLTSFPTSGYDNFPAEVDFRSQINVHGHGKGEISGSAPSNVVRLSAAETEGFHQGFDPSTPAVSERPTALIIQPAPKVNPRPFAEFNGLFYTGGGGLGNSVVMSNGTHSANSQLGVWRFTRAAISFSALILGTPPGNIKIRVTGITGAFSTLLREWDFDPTTWLDNGATKLLKFDIESQLISLSVFAPAGSDSSNHYRIADYHLNQISA